MGETTSGQRFAKPQTPEEEQALQPDETAADQASAEAGTDEDTDLPVHGDPNNPEAGGDAAHPKADEMNVEALRAGATDARSVEGKRLEPFGEGSPAQRDVAPYEVREAEIKEAEKHGG